MTSTPAEFPTLWKVLDRLEQAGIPYMLTGSLALNFYGHVRATNDIDIVIKLGHHEALNLAQLFEADFYISVDAVREAISKKSMFNIIDQEAVFKVDFIIAKDDTFSRQQFQRRQTMAVGDRTLMVISPEDLILSKLEWSRDSLSELQETDIKNIINVIGPDLDRDYMMKWAEHLDVKARLEKIDATL